jgi:flagellum-specific peptidoglycan hydrolase FlgJ
MKTLFLVLLTASTLGKRGELLCSIENNKVSIFFNRIYDDADYVSKSYGLPMSLLMAQAALESGWGMSNLAINKCNYLGIKYKGEYREFSSRKECFMKWGKVLKQNCYNNLQPKS